MKIDTSKNLCWFPPSPFDVVLAKELISMCRRRLTGEQRDILETFFEDQESDEVPYFSDLSSESLNEILKIIRTEMMHEFGEFYL